MSKTPDGTPVERRICGGRAALERLSTPGVSLESAELASLLGARSSKGIGSALRGLKDLLRMYGIGFDEAVRHMPGNGGSVWTAGPRIEQARHIADLSCRLHRDPQGFRQGLPMDPPRPGYTGPVLVLRALYLKGAAFAFDGLNAMERLVDNGVMVKIPRDCPMKGLGEVFIHRIEPGHDGGSAMKIPEGYGEHGTWIRGGYDYCCDDDRRESTGEIVALVCDTSWVERRLVLVDAVRQWEQVGFAAYEEVDGWTPVNRSEGFRAVQWIWRGSSKDSRPPPRHLMLRAWHDIRIETDRGESSVLREEGLRGDLDRTMMKAVARWRRKKRSRAAARVSVIDVKIAARQPRPMP